MDSSETRKVKVELRGQTGVFSLVNMKNGNRIQGYWLKGIRIGRFHVWSKNILLVCDYENGIPFHGSRVEKFLLPNGEEMFYLVTYRNYEKVYFQQWESFKFHQIKKSNIMYVY